MPCVHPAVKLSALFVAAMAGATSCRNMLKFSRAEKEGDPPFVWMERGLWRIVQQGNHEGASRWIETQFGVNDAQLEEASNALKEFGEIVTLRFIDPFGTGYLRLAGVLPVEASNGRL